MFIGLQPMDKAKKILPFREGKCCQPQNLKVMNFYFHRSKL